MTIQEYRNLMNLIDEYGDCCEEFGDYNGKEQIKNCRIAYDKIKDFLQKMLDNAEDL